MGYQGPRLQKLEKRFKRTIEIVKRPQQWGWFPLEVTDLVGHLKKQGIQWVEGFQVLPKRWIVERTFAWIGRYRRMSKDYERILETSETMIYMIMSKLMLKRLEKMNNRI